MSKRQPLGAGIPTWMLGALCAVMALNSLVQTALMMRDGPGSTISGWLLIFGAGAVALVLGWLVWRRLTGREPPRQNA